MDAGRACQDYIERMGGTGLVLGHKYIPEEILVLILSHVDPRDLVFNCRRVCKAWRNVVEGDVWRVILARKGMQVQKLSHFPWFICFWAVTKNFLGRNLIKNGCGQDSLEHWEIVSSGGNEWKVERPPAGSKPFPKEAISDEIQKNCSCFATSYYSCSKKQVIDLKAEGAIPHFMDKYQPHITVSEWYCGRADCRSVYELRVSLLDENEDAVDEFEVRKNVGGADGASWEQVNYVFTAYSSGVRFVEFYHAGMDSQFWQGHYGSKMTGASVILTLP